VSSLDHTKYYVFYFRRSMPNKSVSWPNDGGWNKTEIFIANSLKNINLFQWRNLSLSSFSLKFLCTNHIVGPTYRVIRFYTGVKKSARFKKKQMKNTSLFLFLDWILFQEFEHSVFSVQMTLSLIKITSVLLRGSSFLLFKLYSKLTKFLIFIKFFVSHN